MTDWCRFSRYFLLEYKLGRCARAHGIAHTNYYGNASSFLEKYSHLRTNDDGGLQLMWLRMDRSKNARSLSVFVIRKRIAALYLSIYKSSSLSLSFSFCVSVPFSLRFNHCSSPRASLSIWPFRKLLQIECHSSVIHLFRYAKTSNFSGAHTTVTVFSLFTLISMMHQLISYWWHRCICSINASLQLSEKWIFFRNKINKM